jgi:hypothetical protein
VREHRHFVEASGDVGFIVHSSLEKDLTRITGYERYANHPIAGQRPVKMKVHVAARHMFADGEPVIETIEEIKTQISNVLGNFEPEF